MSWNVINYLKTIWEEKPGKEEAIAFPEKTIDEAVESFPQGPEEKVIDIVAEAEKLLKPAPPAPKELKVDDAETAQLLAEISKKVETEIKMPVTEVKPEISVQQVQASAPVEPPYIKAQILSIETLSADVKNTELSKPEEKTENTAGENTGLVDSMFIVDQDDKDSPLLKLIASLPAVSIQELIDEINELKSMMSGNQPSEPHHQNGSSDFITVENEDLMANSEQKGGQR